MVEFSDGSCADTGENGGGNNSGGINGCATAYELNFDGDIFALLRHVHVQNGYGDRRSVAMSTESDKGDVGTDI